MTQRDGPLTGAPLNFPSDPGGDLCCPPVALYNEELPVVQDPAAVIPIQGVKLDNIVSVEVRAGPVSYGPPPGPLPILGSFGPFAPGVPPALDSLPVILDTSGAAGPFTLVLTNDCGCCAAVVVNVLIP
jgi:hypothetical protein